MMIRNDDIKHVLLLKLFGLHWGFPNRG